MKTCTEDPTAVKQLVQAILTCRGSAAGHRWHDLGNGVQVCSNGGEVTLEVKS